LIEIDNIEACAKANNLTLSHNKTVEVVFTDKNSTRSATPPTPIPGICRSSTLKILGVTVTETLSMAEHIHGIISSCSQILHALRILHSHGTPDVALFEVFHGVVIAKLCYAASAWWGFASADDIQRLNAFTRLSIRHGYLSPDINLADIIDTAQDTLFQQVLNDPHHVLAHLLPNRISSQYKDEATRQTANT